MIYLVSKRRSVLRHNCHSLSRASCGGTGYKREHYGRDPKSKPTGCRSSNSRVKSFSLFASKGVRRSELYLSFVEHFPLGGHRPKGHPQRAVCSIFRDAMITQDRVQLYNSLWVHWETLSRIEPECNTILLDAAGCVASALLRRTCYL